MMISIAKYFYVVLVLTLFLMFSGCYFGLFGGAPKWVKDGSGAFNSDAKIFYGVGEIKDIHNKPLANRTADNKARAELGKVLQRYSASLMRDYGSSSVANDFSESTEKQMIEQAVKIFLTTPLTGVQIVDHWTDKDEGITYSLAKIDLNDFEKQVEKFEAFNDSIRKHLKSNADRLFADFKK